MEPRAQRLKSGVIGTWGLAALVIGVTSPAIGLYAMWGPIQAATGPIAPLVFLAALVIVLPTALSYASLNRHAPSAGATAAWLVVPVVGVALRLSYASLNRHAPSAGATAAWLVVPVVGVALNLCPLYAAFFSSLWSQPLRTGRSVVIVCLAIFAVQLLAALCVRLFRRGLLRPDAPIGAGGEALEANR